MNSQNRDACKPSQEQIIYANLLVIGVWLGLLTLTVTYVIYLAGILTPHIDISIIPTVWGKGVNEYLEITQSPHGWGWTSLLNKGDFLNYLGFAFLALMTVLCFFVLFRGYIRQKNWIYAIIAFSEILVLSLAASGMLGGGGH